MMKHDETHSNMMKQIDKTLVAERFARARKTYAREAKVQRQVAEKMIGLIEAHTARIKYRDIVEIGCGTGAFSRLLKERLQPESCLFNDLCPEMEEFVAALCDGNNPAAGRRGCFETTSLFESGIRFEAGDAEQLTFPRPLDLIASCSTFQWFSDLQRFFHRAHAALNDGGILAFTTFGEENMREIRSLTGSGLDYTSPSRLREMLHEASFDILHFEEEVVSLSFPSPKDVLKHLRMTGVTGTTKSMWTPHRFALFCREYEARFGVEKETEKKAVEKEAGKEVAEEAKKGVTLTYHPIYIIARKNPS